MINPESSHSGWISPVNINEKQIKRNEEIIMEENKNIIEETVSVTDAASDQEQTLEELMQPPMEINPALLDDYAADPAFMTLAAGHGAKVRKTTTTDTKRLFNAISSPSKPIKQVIGETIDVVDIVVTSADVHEDANDPESPLVNKPVVHFFTLDGEHYSSLSNGIIKATENLLAIGIVPTEDNPFELRIITVDTSKGTAHSFEWIS